MTTKEWLMQSARNRWVIAISAFSLALLVCLILRPVPSQASIPVLSGEGEALPTLAPMLEETIPAVVNIATKGRARVENPLMDDPFFRHFFGPRGQEPQYRESQSLGSGVIVDAANGYILTNTHVIDRADEIKVTLNDEREYEAKVIGTDPSTDVAVIQIEADNLQALTLSDSDSLRVGDFVVAIGNPFGLRHTVTSGIVSGLGRSGIGHADSYQDFIQTDASINPGNSGGALVNLKGELVGINAAILSRGGGNIGIGFAIPANLAAQVMNQLIEHGEIRRGRLGVIVQDLTEDLAEAFDMDSTDGVLVAQVQPGSAAEAAGIEPEDIITAINNRPVSNYRDLRNAVGLLQIGDAAELEIVRDGRKRTIEAKITAPAEEEETTQISDIHPRLEGAEFEAIGPEHPLHGRAEGVVVASLEPGSPAQSAGLRNGDVITSVNRQPVATLAEFRQVVEETGEGSLLFNIRRGRGAMFLMIQ